MSEPEELSPGAPAPAGGAIFSAATKLQAAARARDARSNFVRSKSAAVVVQKQYRGWSTRGLLGKPNFAKQVSFTMQSVYGSQTSLDGSQTKLKRGNSMEMMAGVVTQSVADLRANWVCRFHRSVFQRLALESVRD